eukprot:gene1219-1293_t
MKQSSEFLELLRKDDEQKEQKKKRVTRFPSRHFNTQDFLGKYHINKIDNKLTPIPGTQLRIEKEYNEDIDAYHQYVQDVRDQKQKELDLKLLIKQQSVGLQTRVYFDTILGEPIKEAEKILEERDKIYQFTIHPTYKDSPQEIKKFLKNVEQGRFHYVGFAVSHGFESIDYQDPDSGNTAMHLACRLGHPLVVEELLKYNASADMKNALGNYPVHEAWMFWSTASLRTKEERLDQEKRTCEILLALFSYGGFIDAVDLNQQTALHIAARLGPTKAVKLLLTFRANTELRTKDGQTATDIAEEFRQIESYKLLSSWETIRTTFTHTDYHVVWHKFLQDFEVVMNHHKPAHAILSELELANNARHMGREARSEDVLIDDPLLQSAFLLSRAERNTLPPKPWEKGWKRYVKSMPVTSSTSGLEERLESLKNKQALAEKIKSKVKEPSAADIRRNMLPQRELPLTWSDRYGGESGKSQDDRDSKLKEEHQEIKKKISRSNSDSQDEEDNKDDFQVNHVDSFFGITKETQKKKIQYEKSEVRRRRKNYAEKIALDAKFLNYTKRLTHESALALPLRTPKAPLEGTEEENLPMRYILSQGVEFEQLEKYRQKNRLNDLLGIKADPQKSSIGAYAEGVVFNQMIDRDRLFDKLHNIQGLINNTITVSGNTIITMSKEKGKKNTDDNDSLDLDNNDEASFSSKLSSNKIEVEKKQKIDLVNAHRPRYVDACLLPENRVITKIDEMIQEQAIKDEKALLKKLKLNNTSDLEKARAQVEASIVQEQNKVTSSNETYDSRPTTAEKSAQMAKLLGDEEETPFKVTARLELDRQKALQRLFLNKPKIKYGEGRLMSAHNMTGKLEEPWSVIDGRYQTLSGDRTV